MNFERFALKARSACGCWLYARLSVNSRGEWGLIWTYPMEQTNAMFELNPETFCQCTGLKDSEGNLIYENDILETETPHGKENGVVYYQELDTSFRVWQESFTMNLALVMERTRTMDWKVRVIGNRFDKEEK